VRGGDLVAVHEEELPGIGRKFELVVGKSERIDALESACPPHPGPGLPDQRGDD